MAWPRNTRETAGLSPRGETTAVASSAAAQGIGGVVTPLAAWAGYWILAAVLFLFPFNRARGALSSTITGMAPGTPEWYSHFLTSFGNGFSSIGTQTSWVLAIISLVIGLGPSLARRVGVFLFLGGLLSFVLWITGQGFIGGVFSGSGTDPNTGPLVILLALAMVPAAAPRSDVVDPPAGCIGAPSALCRRRRRDRSGMRRPSCRHLPCGCAVSLEPLHAGNVRHVRQRHVGNGIEDGEHGYLHERERGEQREPAWMSPTPRT